jgi:hypothetical protein
MLAPMHPTSTPEAETDLISASFEACATHAPGDDGSPVCTACGWLAGDHDAALAEVRSLPARRRDRAQPRRLAS